MVTSKELDAPLYIVLQGRGKHLNIVDTNMMTWPQVYKKMFSYILNSIEYEHHGPTVVPTKSDSDVILCLHSLSKTLTCTLHLSLHELIDILCINPILRIGLIRNRSIDS